MKDRNRSPTPKPPNLLTDAVVSFTLAPMTDAAGPRRISGVAKEGDKTNLNRRYFSTAVLTAMVAAAQDAVTGGALYGLVQHPDLWWEGPKGLIENVGIRYDRLWMEGQLMRFEGVIVQTAKGRDLQAVVDAGVRVGMSTNVTGSAQYLPAKEVDPAWPDPEDILEVVNEDARLVTIDAVMAPADTAGALNAADELEAPMDLNELKKKHPELVKQIEDGAREKPAAGASQALEDALATERAERLKLERRLQDDARKGMVRDALAAAKLPKLGKSGDVDLDANFAARVERAALAADSDEAASTEVQSMIADRQAMFRHARPGDDTTTEGAEENHPGLGEGGSKKDAAAPKKRSTLSDARRSFGLS